MVDATLIHDKIESERVRISFDKLRRLAFPITSFGDMNDVSSWVSIACKTAIVLLVVNEARGLVLAAPVMWTMYHSGGTLIALWLGFCSLLGIALTVVLPLLAAKAFRRNGQCLVEQGSVHKNSQ